MGTMVRDDAHLCLTSLRYCFTGFTKPGTIVLYAQYAESIPCIMNGYKDGIPYMILHLFPWRSATFTIGNESVDSAVDTSLGPPFHP